MILGTYHFANPNQDQLKTAFDDHLSEQRQDEIRAVTDLLAAFRPTKIAIEVPATDDRLDRDYQTYVDGTRALRVNEAEQLGMRLAKTLGHERVFGIDHRMSLDLDAVIAAAQQDNQTRILGAMRATMNAVADLQQRVAEMSVGQALVAMNDPAWRPEGRDMYLRLVSVREGDGYVGADEVARWYQRNFRMFANFANLAESADDRLLVIVGLGHCPILRELAEADPRFEPVEPAAVLTAK